MSQPCAGRLASISLAFAALAVGCLVCAAAEPKRPNAEEAIRQALAKPIELKYDRLPLNKVADDLQAKLGVPVRLDKKAIEELEVAPKPRQALSNKGASKAAVRGVAELPVTFAVSNVSARAAIDLMLRDLELKTIARGGVLLITTPEVADVELEVTVYDVWDLVEDDDFGNLVTVIRACVCPTTWDEVGGPGSINEFAAAGIRALVVSQTQNVHQEVESLLARLRSLRHARANGAGPTGRGSENRQAAPSPRETRPIPTEDQAKAANAREKAARAALEKRVEVKVDGLPLCDVFQQLSKTVGFPIVLDRMEIVYAGSDPNRRVTLKAPGRKLSTILDELTYDAKLRWTFDREMLLVTTPERETRLLVTRCYDVSDLPSFRGEHGEGVPNYEAIIRNIVASVGPQTWNEADDTHAAKDASRQLIVVCHTWKTQLKVEAFLDKLRAIRGQELTKQEIDHLPPVPEPADLKPHIGLSKVVDGAIDNRATDSAPTALSPDPRRDAVVEAANRFAFDLYGKLDKDAPGSKQGNQFISPFGISTAMAMVYMGARGQTADEMAKTLHLSMPQQDVGLGFRAVLAAMNGRNKRGCRLIVANGLWGQRGYGFVPDFMLQIRTQFDAGLTEVDFAQRDAVCNVINAWADEKTAGRIRQVVSPASIDDLQRFIVANAVYFKGSWVGVFMPGSTKKVAFYSGDQRMDAPTMCLRDDSSRYGVIGDVQVLEKPYRGNQLAMMILLPSNEPGALAKLEQSLSPELVKRYSSALKAGALDVYLPKFTFDTDVRLEKTLAAMGMKSLFQPLHADLSGINAGKEPLSLNMVLHHTFLKVDEFGTEAAAVTAIGGMGGMEKPAPRPPVFRADHPFVFLIRDTRTGAILFLGRLVRPI
ncbi:MAG: serpin family protein [Planctomycetaceae bacterium]|nr:serpin family protein [Planctomycetaceae bacterium]